LTDLAAEWPDIGQYANSLILGIRILKPHRDPAVLAVIPFVRAWELFLRFH
jgi:hypothetical protein